MPTAVKAPPGASSGAARPIVERDKLRGRGGVLRHHGDDAAEASILRAGVKLNKTGMKAAIKADGEHAACLVGGVRDVARTFKIKGQRLFDEDVLAGGDCRQHLRLMQAMRRGEHHGVNVGAVDDFLVAVDERELVLAAEFLGAAARARARQHKANLVALAGNGSNEGTAPAAQPHDSGADHGCVAITATRRARVWRRADPTGFWDVRVRGDRGSRRPFANGR
jgi:hypothetical protein